MTIVPDERYRRHLQLAEVGAAGQARLRSAAALVVGAGGLGCAALPYLVAAGLRAVVVCDGDVVEPSNLPRQVLYGDEDVGRSKAEAASQRLSALNHDCAVTAAAGPLTEANASALVAAADVVLDATDDFTARFRLHDVCFRERRPLVSAAVHHDEGQLAVFRFDCAAAGPCWRCLWPQPMAGVAGDGGCRDQGILGPVPGVLGALQADQALRVLLETSPLGQGQLVHVDLASLSTWRTTWQATPGCALCGGDAGASRRGTLGAVRAADPAGGGEPVVAEEVGWEEIVAPADCLWIDARADRDQAAEPAPAALAGLTLVPWRRFGADGPPPGAPCVVFCGHGIRSLDLVRHWRRRGCAHARSLRGGLSGQRRART